MSNYGGQWSGDQWQQAPPPPGYAPYGPPPVAPQRSGNGCLKALAIVAAVIAGLVVLGGILAAVGGGDQETSEGGDETPAAASDGGQDVYAVGQTAHSGDLDVTVHAVQDPYQPTNEFEVPQAGHRFVAVEAELRNGTDQLVTWSSLMGAELTDSQNRPWTVALAGVDLPQLDGDVPIQGARRGWVVFEVAQDAAGLQIRIKGNATATGSLFRLS